ncbi:DUF1963 domain-containing protein [Streptomyces sediminimaris]|uniref:DUF1963 domain-containing protein n=1 Tax=Streptomyces sediminimaris TaxID=3383721 RepID=UPI0039994E29
MTSEELRERLTRFRDEAIQLGIPAEEADRWIDMVRPCAVLSTRQDGPVAARFGGPVLLPADTPHPLFPHVASIDLAALPPASTDLPLPSDGHLLLFAWPRDRGDLTDHGAVVHVPAGTPVKEHDRYAWDPYGVPEEREVADAFPQGELRVRTEPSLPYHYAVELPDGDLQPLPGFPHAEELAEEWEMACRYLDLRGPLHMGGYADEEMVDLDPLEGLVRCAVEQAAKGRWGDGEPASEVVGDWVLLASWSPDLGEVAAGSSVHWAIQRKDLEAGRFDRTFTSVYWNP